MQHTENSLKNKLLGHLQLILVLTFVISTIAFSKMLNSDKTETIASKQAIKKIIVETVKISPEPYLINFKINGFVETGSKIDIISQVSGRIISLDKNILAGGSFVENQELFTIDPIDFELNIQKIQSQLKTAKADLDLKQAEHDVAISEWKQINGQKPIPDLVSKKPHLDAAKANILSSQANLEIAKLNLTRTKFSFPFAGRVLSSNVAIGQFVNAGQSLGKAFDLESLEISSSLNNDELNWLKKIQNPKITIKTKNGNQYEGNIARISAILDPKTRFTNITFISEEAKKHLTAGEFIEISIVAKKPINVLMIPIEALQEQNQIWIIKDNKLKKKKVEIFQITKNYAISINNDQNFTVAKGNLFGASEGDLVKVSN